MSLQGRKETRETRATRVTREILDPRDLPDPAVRLGHLGQLRAVDLARVYQGYRAVAEAVRVGRAVRRPDLADLAEVHLFLGFRLCCLLTRNPSPEHLLLVSTRSMCQVLEEELDLLAPLEGMATPALLALQGYPVRLVASALLDLLAPQDLLATPANKEYRAYLARRARGVKLDYKGRWGPKAFQEMLDRLVLRAPLDMMADQGLLEILDLLARRAHQDRAVIKAMLGPQGSVVLKDHLEYLDHQGLLDYPARRARWAIVEKLDLPAPAVLLVPQDPPGHRARPELVVNLDPPAHLDPEENPAPLCA